MTGQDGEDGPKAFYILIEVRPYKQDEVVQMLCDICARVDYEPATGPWYALRHSDTTYAIFEAFQVSPVTTPMWLAEAATSPATSSG